MTRRRGRQFDQKRAIRDLRDYRKHGPAATTQALIDALVSAGVQQRTLLDIGGGVGAIQYELLNAGAREATSVDVSAAYLDAARSEAERRGIVGRSGSTAAILWSSRPNFSSLTSSRSIASFAATLRWNHSYGSRQNAAGDCMAWCIPATGGSFARSSACRTFSVDCGGIPSARSFTPSTPWMG